MGDKGDPLGATIAFADPEPPATNGSLCHEFADFERGYPEADGPRSHLSRQSQTRSLSQQQSLEASQWKARDVDSKGNGNSTLRTAAISWHAAPPPPSNRSPEERRRYDLGPVT